MSEDNDEKIITKKHLNSFFDSIDINIRDIIDNRNREQTKQAEMRPGFGECSDDNFNKKHSSEELKEKNQQLKKRLKKK